jgi:type II secretory pathway pseudopilin PulG
MRTRRGHSLVECLITIGLIGATLSIVAVAMSQMRLSCRRVSEASAAELELERFAVQLRSDAHQALSVEREGSDDANETSGTLLFKLSDERSVKYTLRTTHLERLLERGDEIRHRETYRLPRSFTALWQVQTDRSLPLVSLKLEPGPLGPGVPLEVQPIQIDAAVGLFPSLLSRDES